jgi:taurine--2-oxoglutarate transaminase
LVKDKSTKEPMDAATMGAVRNQLVADGLTTFVNQNWVFACPPLCITRDELLTGLHIVEKALAIADAKARA